MTTTSPRAAIRAARKARGWSQIRLAEECCRVVGNQSWTQTRISSYEREGGTENPSIESLGVIADALGLALIVTAEGVSFVDPSAIVLPPEGE